MTSQAGSQAISIHILPNISQSKWNHELLYLHGLTLRILKKKVVGQMFKVSFALRKSK